jgi:hypothetical protein
MCEACDLHAKLMALIEKDGHVSATAPTRAQLETALNALLRTSAAMMIALGGGNRGITMAYQVRSTFDLADFIQSGIEQEEADRKAKEPAASHEAAKAAFDGLMVGSKH